MNERFTGKVAVVTGAASGIGRAVVERLSAEGATVYALDRDEARLQQTIATLSAVKVHSRICDVTDVDKVEPLIRSIADEAGGIHVLVNNAGIGGPQLRTHEYPIEEWDKVMAVNVRGAFAVLKATLGVMLEQGGGNVVNMASIGGFRANSHAVAYLSSKGAMLMMTRSAAMDYVKDNIRINAVCPGVTATEILANSHPDIMSGLMSSIPQGRMGTPEEVAALVAFLASDEVPHVTGAAYEIDGGRSAS